jgi:hypothetical protein
MATATSTAVLDTERQIRRVEVVLSRYPRQRKKGVLWRDNLDENSGGN